MTNISTDLLNTWRKMWNLKVSPKMKIFLWMAISNILPTKDQFRMKKVDVNFLCPVCNVEPKFVLHSLVLCKFAKECRRSTGYIFNDQMYNSFQQWLKMISDVFKKDDMHLIVSIYWSLWRNMNEIVWNQRGNKFVQVVESAKQIFNQWKEV